MNNEILDEQFGVDMTPTVVENERYKIVFDRTKNYLELIKKEEVPMTMEEDEDVGNRVVPTETRYATYYGYCEEDELLDNFDIFWANSWLPQETLLKDDYEVTVNRIHNEIVLVRRLHKATPMNLEEESEVQESQYEYDYKYLPIYEVTASDVMDRFEDFWSLEPLMTFDEPVVVNEVDYSIAGQVLEDGLDLGEGYENLARQDLVYGMFNHSTYFESIYHNGSTTIKNLGVAVNRGVDLQSNVGLIVPQRGIYTIRITIESSAQYTLRALNLRGSGDVKNIPISLGKKEYIFSLNCDGGTIHLYPTGITINTYSITVSNIIITKTSEPKPFIKNSRPDSKLALPQLAELGELKSTEMMDTTLVAKHEQGTVIIKDAKVDANIPDESIQAMLLPTSDNRLMFKSDPKNPVKLKTYMDKTLDECIVEETSDYIIYNDNPDGQPTFACRYDKKSKEIYVGDGYENLGKMISNAYITENTDDYFVVTIPKDVANSKIESYIRIRNQSIEQGDSIYVSIKPNVIKNGGIQNNLPNGNVFILGDSEREPENVQYSLYADSEFKLTRTKELTATGIRIDIVHNRTSYTDDIVIKYNKLQITETPTPKPFVTSYCPTGRIELDKLENIAIKEPVEKDTSNDPLPSLEFGLEAYRNDGKWRLYCATREKYPVGWENIKYEDDPSGASIFYDVSKTSTANNIAGMITVDGKVYIGEGYENLYGMNIQTANIDNLNGTFTRSIEGDVTKFVVATQSNSRSFSISPSIEAGNYTVSFKIKANRSNSSTSSALIRFGGVSNPNRCHATRATTVWTEHKWENIEIENDTSCAFYPCVSVSESDIGIVFEFKDLQITKTSTPKPFIEGIVPSGELKIACDWTSVDKSFVMKNITKGELNSVVLSRNSGSDGFCAFRGSNDGCDFVLSSLIGRTYPIHSAFENKLSSSNELLSKPLWLGYGYKVDKRYSINALQQILIYNNPNLTQAEMEGELAKDIKLHTYKFPISRVNPKFLAGLQPVKDSNGYNKLYFRSEDGQYPAGWDNMTYWEEENGVYTDLPNPNL